MFEVFARYDLIDDQDARPTYADIAYGGAGRDGGKPDFFGAAPADARFSLRLPGRDRGRFPSTPPSSVIGKESSPQGSGYSRERKQSNV